MQDNSADFSRLLATFATLIDIPAGQPIPPGEAWKNDAQVLLIKIYRHLESIRMLFQGVTTTVHDKTHPPYVDHSSIAVLARAAFESYMLFHFIFCAPTEVARTLRYRVWKYAGLKSRQELHGPVTRSAVWDRVLERDRRTLLTLEQEIRADHLFQQYSTERQEKILRQGDVKLGEKWMTLAEASGMPRKYAHDMYNHFCNYAHAGHISILQIRDASRAGDHQRLATGAISFCALLMSQVIANYARLFPDVAQAIEHDGEAAAMVERWQALLDTVSNWYAPERMP
ncbi:MAG TPA: DUF5677 domain-containing protein [Noviherbaspirillum sp.]|nr:DUF5677 domain-containing protein [Noviherbaspirillum sp.]